MSRRRFFGGTAAGKLGFCTAWAVDDHDSGREWIEIVDVSMPVAGLADQLCGKRIIHVSDLHCSRTVSERYLEKCVERVNQLDGDIVVLTGDYITHDFYGTYRQIAVDLIGRINSRFGVYACLGNHDYGIGSVIRSKRDDLLEFLTEGMSEKGVKLLRNESVQVDVDGKPLWFVGLGDLWAGDFNPDKAYSGIDKSQAAITLVHNPKSVKHLKHYHSHAVMSGHTHGVQHPLAGTCQALGKPKYHAGMYEVDGKQLYVNRGLGRLGQIVCSPRPEITVVTLT
ncbi:MAG: metallophosphoesterase [Phycisphaerae bacterium]|nr:metallophosphoesterase [Phycisphaerae bacterium]